LWQLEFQGIDDDGYDLVTIKNVGTGRRLFAQNGLDLTQEALISLDLYREEVGFGGSPGAADDTLFENQKWRQCIEYILRDYSEFVCDTMFAE